MDILQQNKLRNHDTCLNNLSTSLSTSLDAVASSTPTVLYSCSGWSNGSAVIPVAARGKYMAYDIFGTIGYWSLYCSQLTFAAAGACSGACSDNFAQYCCAHMSCGWVGDIKCFNSGEQWSCAGAIAWPFGCSSGCMSACSLNGFNFQIGYRPMSPNGPHSTAGKIAQVCIATSHGPGSSEWCCIGVRNSSRICMCCGADASCLIGACFTTPGGGSGIGCCSSVVIVGYGKIDV